MRTLVARSTGIDLPRFSATACIAALALSLAGCPGVSLGVCGSNADCKSGSRCDTTQSPPVCVVAESSCSPACTGNQTCVAGVCVAPTCSPACPINQLCDSATLTCHPVTVATVAITSPAANAFAGSTLLAAADAAAPGGVSALRFELRRSGSVLAHADALAHPSAGDANSWAASLDLSALPGGSDGPAQLVAVATSSDGDHESAPIAVTIDRTGPTIAITSGAPLLVGGGATVLVSAQLTDSGAGFANGAHATLTFTSSTHAPVTAAISASGVASFSVALDDSLAPPSVATTVTFTLSASDAVGNSSTLANDPDEQIHVNRAAPLGAIDALPGIHSQVDRVTVTGTIATIGGSIQGGETAVVLQHGGTALVAAVLAPGSSTQATWSAQLDLGALALPTNFEGDYALTARLVDSVGNTSLANGNLRIDNEGPQISDVQVLTSPDDPDGGQPLFATSGGALAITAQIADLSGISRASLAFNGQAAVNGTSSDGGSWSFSVPRPSGNFDGTLLPFTIRADDAFADAGLDAGAAAVHSSSDLEAGLTFDNTPPALSVASDATWYARTLADGGANLVTVVATATDGTGIGIGSRQPVLLVGGATLSASSSSGSSYLFQFDPASYVNSNSAGQLSLQVTAYDLVGNASAATSARSIDGARPTLTGLAVYRDGDAAPPSGVGYPPNAGNSGHDGSHFILNDLIHVKGTLADQGAGLGAATFALDGALPDGGIVAGAPIALGCTSGQASCSFDVPIALNAAGNGLFGSPIVDGGTPQGAMTLRVQAEDLSMIPDGGLAHQASSPSSTSLGVTRLLWHQTLNNSLDNTVGGTHPGISGFAMHPDGELIVTGARATPGNTDSLYALHTGDGSLDWSWGRHGVGGSSTVGDINGAPAIGQGDASNARIYVASHGGYLSALAFDGSLVWQKSEAGTLNFDTDPAILETTLQGSGGAVDIEELFAIGQGFANTSATLVGAYRVGNSNPTAVTRALSSTAQATPPLVLQQSVFTGTDDATLARFDIVNGAITPGPTATILSTGFSEPISDGTSIFSGGLGSQGALLPGTIFRESFALDANTGLGSVASGLTGGMVFDPAGLLYGSTGGDLLVSASAGTITTVAQLPAVGGTPLVGANGNLYVTDQNSSLVALVNGAPLWNFSRAHAISASLLLDCQGQLYVGSGNSVYAFVSDDPGLADSPWANHRRDSRASGSGNATRYGSRTTGGCSP